MASDPYDRKYIVHDFRMALLHECGHFFVLDHFGGHGNYHLNLKCNVDPEAERTVGGQTTFFRLPEDPISFAAFGAAGVVAEALGVNPTDDAYSIVEYIENGDLIPSKMDWAAIGDHLTEGVEGAAQILLKHWQEFEAMVAEESLAWAPLVDSRIPPLSLGGNLYD